MKPHTCHRNYHLRGENNRYVTTQPHYPRMSAVEYADGSVIITRTFRDGERERVAEISKYDYRFFFELFRELLPANAEDLIEELEQAAEVARRDELMVRDLEEIRRQAAEIAALREKLSAEEKRHDREEFDLSCEIQPLREEIAALRERIREAFDLVRTHRVVDVRPEHSWNEGWDCWYESPTVRRALGEKP